MEFYVNMQVRSLVGDRGMHVIGKTCKRLKRIRVDQDSQDQESSVYITHTGMIEICEGCKELQFLVLYLSNINNEALTAVGRCLPKLTDFRIVLLEVGIHGSKLLLSLLIVKTKHKKGLYLDYYTKA